MSKGGSSDGIFAWPASHDGCATVQVNLRPVDDPILPVARRVKLCFARCARWPRCGRAAKSSQTRLYGRKPPQTAISALLTAPVRLEWCLKAYRWLMRGCVGRGRDRRGPQGWPGGGEKVAAAVAGETRAVGDLDGRMEKGRGQRKEQAVVLGVGVIGNGGEDFERESEKAKLRSHLGCASRRTAALARSVPKVVRQARLEIWVEEAACEPFAALSRVVGAKRLEVVDKGVSVRYLPRHRRHFSVDEVSHRGRTKVESTRP